jgi:hypothetical protein
MRRALSAPSIIYTKHFIGLAVRSPNCDFPLKAQGLPTISNIKKSVKSRFLLFRRKLIGIKAQVSL